MTYVKRFDELCLDDLAKVGGKNAALGEASQAVAAIGARVPPGFAVTADGYRAFLAHNDFEPFLRDTLAGLDIDDVEALQRCGKTIRERLRSGAMPADLEAGIRQAVAEMGGGLLAVRSSATAEDLPDASFAGQQETYLGIEGPDAVVEATRKCFASLFTDRAISYRQQRHFEHLQVALSVGVQRLVRADRGSSGVMFTLDTESGFPDVVQIDAVWGLGELLVQGIATPDEYLVFKPTLAEHRPILRRALGRQDQKMVLAGVGTAVVDVPADDRERFVLSEDEVLLLARVGVAVEAHWSARRGAPCPMDIEWAKDGDTGEIFVVQARPETVHSRRVEPVIRRHLLTGKGTAVAEGTAVGDGIAHGRVRVLQSAEQLADFEDGEILVASRTDPDWEPVMRRAAAVITDHGGRTCHAAIVCRELGIPAVVGTHDASVQLTDGALVTVSCVGSRRGVVYGGEVAHTVEDIALVDVPATRTKIMLNVGVPSEAFSLSQLPAAGVGLARIEFVIGAHIGIHPLALCDYDSLEDELRAAVDAATPGYEDKPEFFVDQLSQGIGQIAAAFWPRPVIVRMSDFKTNEYMGLLGGALYEEPESNPMIGFRGASRYAHDSWAPALALECQALRRVRDQMGLTNVKLMIPFCRTPAEGQLVLDALAAHGLTRGQDGLEIYVMVEIPSNALQADAFAELFDGFSIGSNDLTQLTLGIDRDSEILAEQFNEGDAAVRALIVMAIEGGHRAGIPVGICGQAPSDRPEFAEWLVQVGIDSLSLVPDAWLSTLRRIAVLEGQLS